jgi:hypothetical protein
MTNQGRHGDFEQVMLPHLDAAYNLARWLVRDPSIAEDVVQDAYERACKYQRFAVGLAARGCADRPQRRLLDAQSSAAANGGFAQQWNACGR